MDQINTAHWRGTSADGRTVNDIGARIVEIRTRYDEEFRECSRQFATCLGLKPSEGTCDGLQGTLENYLASTDNKGFPEGLSTWLEAVEAGTIVAASWTGIDRAAE
jgi:hypothetical protein